MVIRLWPCMRSSTYLLSNTPPPHTHTLPCPTPFITLRSRPLLLLLPLLPGCDGPDVLHGSGVLHHNVEGPCRRPDGQQEARQGWAREGLTLRLTPALTLPPTLNVIANVNAIRVLVLTSTLTQTLKR